MVNKWKNLKIKLITLYNKKKNWKKSIGWIKIFSFYLDETIDNVKRKLLLEENKKIYINDFIFYKKIFRTIMIYFIYNFYK